MQRYEVFGSCLVDNETGRVRLEAVDTPRNRRKLSKLADLCNRQERQREQLNAMMRRNTAAFI